MKSALINIRNILITINSFCSRQRKNVYSIAVETVGFREKN